MYRVDTSEVAGDIPNDFTTFNDFFTRELADGARSIDDMENSIIAPADGTVSIATELNNDTIVQAKGLDYTLDELFAIDLERAHAFSNGSIATIYLAPHNYHRVHMPIAGELVSAHYVPGDLFSVNSATVMHLRGLFRRNERLNLHFETAFGPAALMFVGALNVGSISTPWSGEIRPRKKGIVEILPLGDTPRILAKGDLLGWFNMGSTVILLLPKGVAVWNTTMKSGKALRMGEAIAAISSPG
jgi:phosphatidylserine decarboxylase